jgi:hypothetical protein
VPYLSRDNVRPTDLMRALAGEQERLEEVNRLLVDFLKGL